MPRPARVLVVDDNEDARELLASLLVSHGYVVATAADADAALELAARFRPDAAVLDLGLPGMDGWALARALREIAELAQIRIVALTGYGTARDRDRSREAGIDEHLLKPIAVAQLRRSLALELG